MKHRKCTSNGRATWLQRLWFCFACPLVVANGLALAATKRSFNCNPWFFWLFFWSASEPAGTEGTCARNMKRVGANWHTNIRYGVDGQWVGYAIALTWEVFGTVLIYASIGVLHYGKSMDTRQAAHLPPSACAFLGFSVDNISRLVTYLKHGPSWTH